MYNMHEPGNKSQCLSTAYHKADLTLTVPVTTIDALRHFETG